MHALWSEVRRIAAAYAAQQAPLTPQSLCDGIGASLRYAPLPEGKFGSYIESKNLIIIDENSSPKRQRFTLAHEVMHALIYQHEDLLSDMHDTWEGADFEFYLEVLCNVGASEMLLPSIKLEQAVAAGLKPRLIPDLANSFQVSEAAVAVALASRAQPCAAIIVRNGMVSFCAQHPQLGLARIVKGRAFARNHPMSEVAQTGLPYRGQHVWDGQPVLLQCLARAGRLYALLTALRN